MKSFNLISGVKMRIKTLFIIFLVSTFSMLAQQKSDNNIAVLDGVSLGMTKDQVLKQIPAAASNGMDNNLWLFDSTSLSIGFDENGLVSEVMSDFAFSSVVVNGFEIKIESDIQAALDFLGKPDKTFKTEMVMEYYFAKTGIVLLTYADDNAIKLISLQKNYDK